MRPSIRNIRFGYCREGHYPPEEEPVDPKAYDDVMLAGIVKDTTSFKAGEWGPPGICINGTVCLRTMHCPAWSDRFMTALGVPAPLYRAIGFFGHSGRSLQGAWVRLSLC